METADFTDLDRLWGREWNKMKTERWRAVHDTPWTVEMENVHVTWDGNQGDHEGSSECLATD